MTTYTLPRTGSAPVRIDAERIAHAETTAAHDKERCWYTLSIYRLDDGRLAYTVGFRSGWEKEKPWDWAVVVRDESALVTALEDLHEPPAVGWPPHPKYEMQNRKFFAELEAHYRSAVQRAIEESGIVLGADAAQSTDDSLGKRAIEVLRELHSDVVSLVECIEECENDGGRAYDTVKTRKILGMAYEIINRGYGDA